MKAGKRLTKILLITWFLMGWQLATPPANQRVTQNGLPEEQSILFVSSSMESPLTVKADFSSVPQLGAPVDLLIEAATLVDAPNTQITVTLSAGIQALSAEMAWQGDLAAGETASLSIPLKVVETGEQQVTVQAVSHLPGGSTIGENKYLYLEVTPERVLLSNLPPYLRQADITNHSQGVRIEDGEMAAPQPYIPNQVAGTVRLRGFFGYEDQSNTVTPVRRAKVEIWDSDDPGDDDLLATVYTDLQGFYEATVDNSDASGGVDAYARVYSTDGHSVEVRDHNDTSDVTEPGGDLYDFTTPISSNIADGDFFLGGYKVNDAANRQAWYILDKVAVDAHDFLQSQAGWHNTYNIEIRWTPTVSNGSAFYNYDDDALDFIHLQGTDGWDEDVALHEFGHFVMERIYTTYPPTPSCNPHYWGAASSDGCAWSEGWATFLQGAIQGHNDYWDTVEQNLHIQMEPPLPGVASSSDEAAVGASLWDIFDTVDETHDTLDSGFNGAASNGLWKIISEDDPNTAGDFWNAWFESSNGSNCALHNILDHHLIPTFNACAPPAPTASDGSSTSQVTITWPAYPGASEYKVYRATSSGGTKTLLTTTASLTYNDSAATAERVYYYFYTACNSHACGDFSFHDTGWRAMPIPTGVAASDGTFTDKIRVTWNSVADAASYQVYSATSAGGTQTLLGSSSTTTYDYTTATPEQTYYLFVRACNAYGCSQLSSSNTGYREMPVPTNVSASDGTYTNKVRVSWSSISGATYYKIYRGTSIGGQTYLADSSNAYYDDTSATQGRTYYYYVQALNVYGSGAQSTYNGGWRNMAVPTTFSASDGSYSDKVYLNWTAVSGATYYEIWRADTQGGGGSRIAAPSAPPYNDTSALILKHYWYQVNACNAYVCSALTAENEGWRGFPGPTGVSASDGTYIDKVQITWNSVSGATSYQVYRGTTTSNQTLLDSVSAVTVYDDTSATPELVYYYDVIACNGYGCGAHSSDDTGFREMDTPTGISASDGAYSGMIRVTFNAVSGATYYKIYRGAAPDSLSYLGDAVASPFDDSSPTTTSQYYFAVQACNGSGCGAISASDSGSCTIGTAQNISATDGTYKDKVQITWSSVPTAHHYHVYKIEYWEQKIGETSTTSFNDLDAFPRKPLEYFIVSCDQYDQCGDPSAHDTGWRRIYPLLNFSASEGTFLGAVLLTWEYDPEYEPHSDWVSVSRKLQLGGVWEEIAISFTTYYIDMATPNQGYDYMIRNCNDYGCGSYTPSDYGYARDTTTQVTASDGASTDYVDISWNAVDGADFYYIVFGNDPESVFMNVTWTYDLSYRFYTDLFYGNPAYFSVYACASGTPQGDFCPQLSPPDIGWQLVPAPANLQASDGSYTGGVRLTWNQILTNYNPAVHYEIFRAEALDAPKEYLGDRVCVFTTCNATFVDNAPPGVVYYYWVQASREEFESQFSAPDSGYSPYELYLPLLTRATTSQQSSSLPPSLAWLGLGVLAYQLLRRSLLARQV